MQNCTESESRAVVFGAQFIGGIRLDALPANIDCILAAGANCAAARACLNGGQPATACTAAKPSCLDATTVVSCVSGWTQRYPCTGGTMCVTTATDGAFCGFGSCNSSFVDRCVGNQVEACDVSVVYRQDCASYGDVCGTVNGMVECTSAVPCTGGGCQGDVLVCYTAGGGVQSQTDCSLGGLRCLPNASGSDTCILGTDCDTVTYAPSCSGATLTYCNSGKVLTFDCAAAGFSGCDASGGGACRP
jgi:hypothetical protein